MTTGQTPRARYVIQHEGTGQYWSTLYGWIWAGMAREHFGPDTSDRDISRYTEAEREAIDLPANGRWVEIHHTTIEGDT